jgi:hypothetical protein
VEVFSLSFGSGCSVYITKHQRGFFHMHFGKYTCMAFRRGGCLHSWPRQPKGKSADLQIEGGKDSHAHLITGTREAIIGDS